jgi:hypothetical protein
LSFVNDTFFFVGSGTLGNCFSGALLRRLVTKNELIWETEADDKGGGGGVVRCICQISPYVSRILSSRSQSMKCPTPAGF